MLTVFDDLPSVRFFFHYQWRTDGLPNWWIEKIQVPPPLVRHFSLFLRTGNFIAYSENDDNHSPLRGKRILADAQSSCVEGCYVAAEEDMLESVEGKLSCQRPR